MYFAANRDDLLPDEDATRRQTMTALDFFRAISEPTPPFLYFTEPLWTLAGGSLIEHAPDWEGLVPPDAREQPAWVQLRFPLRPDPGRVATHRAQPS